VPATGVTLGREPRSVSRPSRAGPTTAPLKLICWWWPRSERDQPVLRRAEVPGVGGDLYPF